VAGTESASMKLWKWWQQNCRAGKSCSPFFCLTQLYCIKWVNIKSFELCIGEWFSTNAQNHINLADSQTFKCTVNKLKLMPWPEVNKMA